MSILSITNRHVIHRRHSAADRCRRTLRRSLRAEPLESRRLLAGDAGASLVADINPGPDSSGPRHLTNVDNSLYFSAYDLDRGIGVYLSDGTGPGTQLIKGGFVDAPADFTSFDGSVYFGGAEGLWKTDGTSAGTMLVSPVYASGLAVMGDIIVFSGFDGGKSTGNELWKTDGTSAGTTLVKDIYTGGEKADIRCRNCGRTPNSSSPQWLTELNGTVLFAATNGNRGRELWTSDGTAGGTKLLKDIQRGKASSNPHSLLRVGDEVFFSAAAGLWKTDGTEDGTTLVSDLPVPGQPENLVNVSGDLYFTISSQLWTSDGTFEGTTAVTDLESDGANLFPEFMTNVNGRLYFSASDGVHGKELWQHDISTGATELVRDIHEGSAGSYPEFLTVMNDRLYFAATDAVHGRELWDPPPVEAAEEEIVALAHERNAPIGAQERRDTDVELSLDETDSLFAAFDTDSVRNTKQSIGSNGQSSWLFDDMDDDEQLAVISGRLPTAEVLSIEFGSADWTQLPRNSIR